MTMKARIEAKLNEAFRPLYMEVLDESSSHAGHAGARPGGETHFRVRLISEAFRGRTRVDRHRLVYDVLARELRQGIHALTVEAREPDEAR